MKHIWIPLTIILLAGTSCQDKVDVTADKVDVAADKQDLLQIGEDWDRYALAGDYQAQADLYTDDAIRIDFGKIYEGKEAIRNLLQSYSDDITLSNENQTEDIIISGDIAFIRGSFSGLIISSDSGDTLHIKGTWADLCERQSDGSWKMTYSIGTDLID